jgi:hypothetical protein
VYVAPDDKSMDATVGRASNRAAATRPAAADPNRVRDYVYAAHAAVADSPQCFSASERIEINAGYEKWKR